MTDRKVKLVEQVARIIAPERWAVMDRYLEQAKHKYRGERNVMWAHDQFHDKQSMAKAREIVGLVLTARAGMDVAQ